MKRTFTLTLSIALTLTTHTVYAQGSNHALDFDGSGSYFAVNDSPSLQPNDTLTVSTWAYLPSHSNTTYLVRKWLSTNGGWGSFSIIYDDNERILWNVQNQSLGQNPVWITTPIAPDQWHHIACVYTKGNFNASDAKIYIDGVLQTTTFDPRGYNSSFSIQYSSENLNIGRATPFGPSFTGQMDEVEIWNLALSETDIREDMCQRRSGSENGLVAYYRMDEGLDNSCAGGEDVCDLTSNGNHGTKF